MKSGKRQASADCADDRSGWPAAAPINLLACYRVAAHRRSRRRTRASCARASTCPTLTRFAHLSDAYVLCPQVPCRAVKSSDLHTAVNALRYKPVLEVAAASSNPALAALKRRLAMDIVEKCAQGQAVGSCAEHCWRAWHDRVWRRRRHSATCRGVWARPQGRALVGLRRPGRPGT